MDHTEDKISESESKIEELDKSVKENDKWGGDLKIEHEGSLEQSKNTKSIHYKHRKRIPDQRYS